MYNTLASHSSNSLTVYNTYCWIFGSQATPWALNDRNLYAKKLQKPAVSHDLPGEPRMGAPPSQAGSQPEQGYTFRVSGDDWP